SPCAARRWPASASTRPCPAATSAGPGTIVRRPDMPEVSSLGPRRRMNTVITEAELRRLTPEERSQLARTLAAIDHPHPLTHPPPRGLRRRRFGLLFMLACCLGLAAWIAILLVTLPMRYVSHDWRGVWVGLDLAELAGFAATAWAAWYQRQVLIVLMNATGTL